MSFLYNYFIKYYLWNVVGCKHFIVLDKKNNIMDGYKNDIVIWNQNKKQDKNKNFKIKMIKMKTISNFKDQNCF